VWNRTRSRAEPLAEAGAVVADLGLVYVDAPVLGAAGARTV
jgi:hypothetical protein